MGRSTSEAKIKKKFDNALVRYDISEREEDIQKNRESLPKFQEILKKAGIHFIVKDNQLTLYLVPESYTRNQTRYAGVRRHQIEKEKGKAKDEYNVYRYSDIVYMMQSMSDMEIKDTIEMSHATYYRHKKALLESNYWRLLDKERLNDEKYLREQPFNRAF